MHPPEREPLCRLLSVIIVSDGTGNGEDHGGRRGEDGCMNSMVPELEAYISFRLGQLSERNEHHTFETIATRIARKRISANILVANGPVSAGGDQQRDAESYTTRIPEELPNAAGFSASASTAPVVVACTIQKTALKKKILDDLAGICADDAAPVELVAFFSVHSIPEAITHEVQEIARTTYGVTLDVYSGMKVATILAEPELVWVAQHYLGVPAAMVPDPEDVVPNWYRDLRDALRRNGAPLALTPATQGEIAQALRFATWDEVANADLPEWLDFMGAFVEKDTDNEMVFHACYEIAIARFRGLGVAGTSEDLIRRAVEYALSSAHANILDDAVTLVAYWGNMWIAGVATAAASETAEARERLREHITAELAATDGATYPVRSASLTGTLAYLHLLPKWEEAEENGFRPPKTEVAPHAGVKLDSVQVDPSFANGPIDLDIAMQYLEDLVDLLPQARPYSVSNLSKIFTMFAPAVAAHPSYVKVRDALDARTAEVQGDAAIAERCRDRAIAFENADQPLEALAELHTAKARWFHGDLMYGAVLVSRYIAKIYLDLGLTYASKMYACGAAMMANQSPDDDVKTQVPKALFEVVTAAQVAGCWVDAAALTEIALLAHNSLAPDAFDASSHPDLEHHHANELMEYVAVRAFWPDIEPLYSHAHRTTGRYELLAEQASHPDAAMPLDEDRFQELAREQFAGPVLADLGATRTIDFAALGVRWIFTFDNEHASVLTAEGLVAAFQVFLADAARFHPVLIRATTRVRIETNRGAPHARDEVRLEDGEDEVVARINWSDSTSDLDEISRSIISTSIQLLAEVHARPREDLMAILDSMGRDGIFHKVLMGRPYNESADLLDEEHYARCAEAARPASSDAFTPSSHESLEASTREGPDYNRSEALERIQQRYRTAESWSLSLAAFLADPRGRDAISRLKDDGWLDWQILVTFVNIGLNWRVQREGIEPMSITPAQMRELATRIEVKSEPRLPVDFVLEHLENNLLVQTAAVARTWKLQTRGEVPGSDILRDLLVRRYHFGRDDFPHTEILELA